MASNVKKSVNTALVTITPRIASTTARVVRAPTAAAPPCAAPPAPTEPPGPLPPGPPPSEHAISVHAHVPFVHVQVLQSLCTSAPTTEHGPPGVTRRVVFVGDVELPQAMAKTAASSEPSGPGARFLEKAIMVQIDYAIRTSKIWLRLSCID